MISATNLFVLIGEINVAYWMIKIIRWFWKSRNWKLTPWLYLQGRQPW